jgi:hypothetical protein
MTRFADQTLPIRIHYETDEVRTHVVSPEIVQRLTQLRFVEVDVHEHEAFEVLGGFLDQALAVGSVDARVAVVDAVVFRLLSGGSLEFDAFGRDGLEGCQGEGAGFDGVGGCDDVGVGVADVGVWVGVFEGGGVWVERPMASGSGS